MPEPENGDQLGNVRVAELVRGKELTNLRNTLDPVYLL